MDGRGFDPYSHERKSPYTCLDTSKKQSVTLICSRTFVHLAERIKSIEFYIQRTVLERLSSLGNDMELGK
jgi:hypothetical protein